MIDRIQVNLRDVSPWVSGLVTDGIDEMDREP
jgi:hypothetical protein